MIYLDNNATTQIAPEVIEAMMPYLTSSFGNPSSAYTFGRASKFAIEGARADVAALIGAEHPFEVVFTSSGTESDNWAILGTLETNPDKKHIITTSVEHEAIFGLCKKLETKGYEVSYLGVDENGLIDLEELKSSLREDTAIVSAMMANNETGILFPVAEIAEIVKANSNAVFHSDAVNAVGKIPIDIKETKIDLLSFSGHKCHAPKGIGAIYIKQGLQLPSFFVGGGQEAGRRAGTEALHQIVGFGAAAKLVKTSVPDVRRLRDKLEDGILQSIPNTKLNGTPDRSQRTSNTSSIAFSNINGESILAKVNDLEIYVSTGSACNAAKQASSNVLRSMNVPFADAMGTVRFSLGRYNTDEEIDFVLETLPKIIGDLRSIGL